MLGFTMGPFGTIERPWKPFNPILGETFEYARPAKGMKFIAEQVRLQGFCCVADCWWLAGACCARARPIKRVMRAAACAERFGAAVLPVLPLLRHVQQLFPWPHLSLLDVHGSNGHTLRS